MPYPDLEPSPTFWRCPRCANETMFRASGTAAISCGRCQQVATAEELLEAHARSHPTAPAEPAH